MKKGWIPALVPVLLILILAGVLLRPPKAGPSVPAPEQETAAPTPPPAPQPTQEPTTPPAPQPTQEPTTPPVPEPTPPATAAERMLEGMSLREKLCQLLIVRPSDLSGAYPVLRADEALRRGMEALPAGGLFLDGDNMQDSAQLKALTGELAAMTVPVPLIVCDEEGGTVGRLMNKVGTTKIGAMFSYRDQGRDTAYQNAETIARDLLAHGFNADFAPVADVWSNPKNTVIRTRAYSDDFAQTAELVAAAVEGFHAGGVACTLKHFPGHGDSQADSHYGTVTVTKSLDELREGELLPFRAGIEAGADMVMIGHLTVPALDAVPAPFSYRIVTELLREELGFGGVVVTDALAMGALADYGCGEAAVLAIQAGVDLLLCPEKPEEALQALMDAVGEGTLTDGRIDESVLRILTMKEAWGLLDGSNMN